MYCLMLQFLPSVITSPPTCVDSPTPGVVALGRPDMADKDDRVSTSAPPKLSIDKSSTLGVGSYGTVFIAHWNQLTCAAKIIHASLLSRIPGKPNAADKFMKECEVLSKFRHPNVVQFLGVLSDPDTRLPVLLMELMEKNLTNLLEEATEPLPYPTQIGMCYDIALAITYVHSMGFIHRDISGNNVLMKGGVAKLADLGVTVLIDSSASSRQTVCPGTEVYMPPDSVSDSPTYTEKIDCFSFGVLTLQIITLAYPKPGPRHRRVILAGGAASAGNVMWKQVPEVERRKEQIEMVSADHPLLELLLKCLREEEEERPSAVEICSHLARLHVIEEDEARVRAGRGGGASPSGSGPRVEWEESLACVMQLQECRGRVAALEGEVETKNATIARLERENAALLPAPIQVRTYKTHITLLEFRQVML